MTSLFLWLNFVTPKILLGLSKHDVLAKLFAVLFKSKLLRGVLSVLASVVNTLTRLFTHESDQFTFVAFVCDISSILTDSFAFVKQKYRLIIPVFLLPAEIWRSFANYDTCLLQMACLHRCF